MSGIPFEQGDLAGVADQLRSSLDRARAARRRRLLLEGVAIVLAVALVGLLASIVAIKLFGLSIGAVAWLRIGFVLVVLLAAARWLLLPLFRRPSDAMLARYIEERHPAFRQALVTAVEWLDVPSGSDGSPGLGRRVVGTASAELTSVADGRSLEAAGNTRALRRMGVVAGLWLALLLLLPSSWRPLLHGFLAPWTPATDFVAVRSLAVQPGDLTVPRGSSIDVVAQLSGFDSDEAVLLVQRESSTEIEVVGMHPDGEGRFAARLFGLDSSFTYLVEADGVRSRQHRVIVTDLPAVRTLEVELDYPDYTGLVTEVNDFGGDVAAVVGTAVEVRPQLTMPVSGAVLRFDDGRRVPFAITDSLAPVARFRVARSGFYSIDLVAPDGTVIPGTIRWAVDALPDRAPVVRITQPGRDTRATNVEEVAISVAVDDDYGVSSVRLVASVNGGEEVSIPLVGSLPPGTLTPRAAHTVFLEEMDLKPGDLVSYHAVARDGAGNESTSDIYFIEIRPYSRNYRQAEQGAAPGQAGSEGEQQGDEQDLSREQRRLIVATFNVKRDSADTPASRLGEDIATVAVGQERLLDRVKELSNDMLVRGAASIDSTFVDIRAALDSAGRAMDASADQLRRGRLTAALPLEQQSLQQLQRAEALYRDVQMQLNQSGAGGRSGAAGAPEDLADLFDLNRDELRNQYEAVQREASGGGTEQAVDEARERLRDLARRLEQENERQQRMMAQRGQGQQSASGGSTGAAQRRFAEEAEEEARRLERLAREQDTPELRQAAQAARAAADALRRAASGQSGQEQEAVESLLQASRDVAGGQESSARREAERLANEASRIAREQREQSSEAANLPPIGNANRDREVNRLQQEGNALSRDADRLQGDLERSARSMRGDDPASSQALAEAAQRMREFQVPERIGQAAGAIGNERIPVESLQRYNEQIAQLLEEVRDRVARGAQAVGSSPERQREQAMERARELVRGMESTQQRAAEGGERQGQQQATTGDEGRQGAPSGGGQQQAATGSEGRQGAATGNQQSGGDARQLSRELGMRLGAATELREGLREQGVSVESLDQAIATLRRLQQDLPRGNPTALADLTSQALELLREAEFDLWRRFGGGTGGLPAVGDPGRVSPRYRQQVEEYFRSIARDRP